jgi:hypothetical protein
MSKKARSADLIMKLYDLRREATMREARNWFVSFFPESSDDLIKTMIDPKTSAYFRMVVTYWDMAAGFVNHGAIDREMFCDSNSEFIVVFSKIEPFLAEFRDALGSPDYLKGLETLVMGLPDAETLLAARREQMKRWMKAREEGVRAAG